MNYDPNIKYPEFKYRQIDWNNPSPLPGKKEITGWRETQQAKEKTATFCEWEAHIKNRALAQNGSTLRWVKIDE